MTKISLISWGVKKKAFTVIKKILWEINLYMNLLVLNYAIINFIGVYTIFNYLNKMNLILFYSNN